MRVNGIPPPCMFDAADSHRPILGKRIPRLLSLKTQLGQHTLGKLELTAKVDDQQVDIAFAATAGNCGTADVFDSEASVHSRNGVDEELRDCGRPRVVVVKRRMLSDVLADCSIYRSAADVKLLRSYCISFA